MQLHHRVSGQLSSDRCLLRACCGPCTIWQGTELFSELITDPTCLGLPWWWWEWCCKVSPVPSQDLPLPQFLSTVSSRSEGKGEAACSCAWGAMLCQGSFWDAHCLLGVQPTCLEPTHAAGYLEWLRSPGFWEAPCCFSPRLLPGWDPTESLTVTGRGKSQGTSGAQAEQLDPFVAEGPGGKLPAVAARTAHVGKHFSLG